EAPTGSPAERATRTEDAPSETPAQRKDLGASEGHTNSPSCAAPRPRKACTRNRSPNAGSCSETPAVAEAARASPVRARLHTPRTPVRRNRPPWANLYLQASRPDRAPAPASTD